MTESPYEKIMRERREQMEAEELAVVPKNRLAKTAVQMSAPVSKPVVQTSAQERSPDGIKLPDWKAWKEESKSRYMELVKRRLDQLESREEVAAEAGVSLNQLGIWIRETMLDPVE